jgi:hypothetical protein
MGRRLDGHDRHDAGARHPRRARWSSMSSTPRSSKSWRGMGVQEVDTRAKPEKRDKSINSAVTKIFRNYPPKQGN